MNYIRSRKPSSICACTSPDYRKWKLMPRTMKMAGGERGVVTRRYSLTAVCPSVRPTTGLLQLELVFPL
jgi:hypothetical protein